MVGVPGRSKSCNTCRKRKVSCSLEKPECMICVKSGRVCAGYARERIFIQQQVPGQGKARFSTQEQSSDISTAISTASSSNSGSPVPAKAKTDLAELRKRSKIEQVAVWKMPIISPSTRAAFRQQILSEFIHRHSPVSTTTAAIIGRNRDDISGNWFVLLPDIDFTTALETSVLAVTTAKLGQISDDPALMRESLKFYVQGLWELQKALWDPKLMYKDETFAACMLLAMYEVVECPDRSIDGWLRHMKGCATLMELRGPRACGSEFGRRLFLSFRLGEIQQAITERRSTFLEKSEWAELPFKTFPKSLFHQLLDIMAAMANVIGAGYQMLDKPENMPEPTELLLGVLQLLERCWKIDARLREFWQTLESDNAGPIYWPGLSILDDDLSDDPKFGKTFPVAFQFQNLRIAHTCMLYWGSCSILWSGMGYVYNVLAALHAQQVITSMESPVLESNESPVAGFNFGQLPPLEHRTDITVLARNICQSLEYVLLEKSGEAGPMSAVFPLKVAIETFHDVKSERELAWASATLGKIIGRGLRLMGHLPMPITDHTFLPG